jgi:hypothetical protein
MPKNVHEQELNKSAGNIVDVPCSECKRPTKHKVLASVDISGEDWYQGNSVQYNVHHQIVQCQGCETVTFRIASTNSEDFEPIDHEGNYGYVESLVLYPSRNEGRVSIKDSHILPQNVQRIYDETIKAMNNDQPVLAGIGIRALVETICKDKLAEGKNLEQKIDALIKMGVLTPEGATILHQIRTLGNDAAHEVKPHKFEQLSLALDVCEHLLQGVYLLTYYAQRTFN